MQLSIVLQKKKTRHQWLRVWEQVLLKINGLAPVIKRHGCLDDCRLTVVWFLGTMGAASCDTLTWAVGARARPVAAVVRWWRAPATVGTQTRLDTLPVWDQSVLMSRHSPVPVVVLVISVIAVVAVIAAAVVVRLSASPAATTTAATVTVEVSNRKRERCHGM